MSYIALSILDDLLEKHAAILNEVENKITLLKSNSQSAIQETVNLINALRRNRRKLMSSIKLIKEAKNKGDEGSEIVDAALMYLTNIGLKEEDRILEEYSIICKELGLECPSGDREEIKELTRKIEEIL